MGNHLGIPGILLLDDVRKEISRSYLDNAPETSICEIALLLGATGDVTIITYVDEPKLLSKDINRQFLGHHMPFNKDYVTGP